MNSWGLKKQILYISLFSMLVIIVSAPVIYFKFIKKTPTCFDGVLNQDERNVDCGGVCQKICLDEAKPIVVQFERFFESAPGVFMAVAQVENVNQQAHVKKAPYAFRVYDKEGVLLEERKGVAFIPPSATFPILEYSIYAGERIPAKVSFYFEDNLLWEKGNIVLPKIELVNQSFTEGESSVALRADVVSKEVYAIKNLKAIALIYDTKNNVRRSSSTVIAELGPKGKSEFAFMWNEAFDFEVGKADIVPILIPRDFK